MLTLKNFTTVMYKGKIILILIPLQSDQWAYIKFSASYQ
jgi:hypothetical protein